MSLAAFGKSWDVTLDFARASHTFRPFGAVKFSLCFFRGRNEPVRRARTRGKPCQRRQLISLSERLETRWCGCPSAVPRLCVIYHETR